MRIAAIILNILQILIIMSFYFDLGLSLGGWAMLSLFILLLIAGVNVLVHLFYSPLNVTPAQEQEPAENGKLVKRQDLRVLYSGELQPTLQWAKRRAPVIDLSQNGLRIIINRQEKIPKRFRGRLPLLSGKVLPLKLTLLRREGDQAALLIKDPIDNTIIQDEKQRLTNHPDTDTPG